MTRVSVWVLTAALASAAPYQCKSTDPERARDDTPSEALWALCGRLADAGDADGVKRTLDFLVERYPASREARRAEDERKADKPCGKVTAELAAAAKPKGSASK